MAEIKDIKKALERQEKRIKEILDWVDDMMKDLEETKGKIELKYKELKEKMETKEEEEPASFINIRDILPVIIIGVIGWIYFQKKGLIPKEEEQK